MFKKRLKGEKVKLKRLNEEREGQCYGREGERSG